MRLPDILTEQAYINGFVKKAALHGVSAEDALYMLKEATTFGATRKLLKQLKAQGFKLYRRPTILAKDLLTEVGEPADFKNLLDVSRELKNTGSFLAIEKGKKEHQIYIPRSKFLKSYKGKENTPVLGRTGKIVNMKENYSPRRDLFHEAGHAEHYSEDPDVLHKARVSQILQERIANNNAINFMKNNNVPKSHIDNYIKDMDSSFATYRRINKPKKDHIFEGLWRPYSPSYSVEI